jgi:hypothetical protein
MKNLQAGVLCPFNAIIDYQQFASSLVISQSNPPTTRVSEDGATISYKEHTCNISHWISGLHKVHNLAKDAIDQVCQGNFTEVKIPAGLPDDWTVRTRKYSWLNNGTFVKDDHPLCKILMGDKHLRLCSLDRDGQIQYNTGAMLNVMQQAANINKLLSFLTFTTSGQPSHVTEFMDHKIRNSTRPHTVFYMDFGWSHDKSSLKISSNKNLLCQSKSIPCFQNS